MSLAAVKTVHSQCTGSLQRHLPIAQHRPPSVLAKVLSNDTAIRVSFHVCEKKQRQLRRGEWTIE